MLVLSTVVVVFVATFLAATVAVAVAWVMMRRRRGQNQDPWPALDDSDGSPLLLKNEQLSTVGVWAAVLARFDYVHRMKERLEEAHLDWTVGRLTLSMLLCGAVALAALAGIGWIPGWVLIAAGCGAAAAPYLYVLRLRARRLAKFEEQFPDALDFLSRALRAGHPFAVSLEMLAQESPAPLSEEMRKTFDERQLGMSWEQALRNLTRRVPLVDLNFFAAAVQLQSRTGGKLGEVLSRLAETMRERFALRGEIRAIAAHGRLTGIVLTLIPIIVAGVMAAVNPDYLRLLLQNPVGRNLIWAAAGCLAAAHLIIRRIVSIKL
jgi:tight adherence protein B